MDRHYSNLITELKDIEIYGGKNIKVNGICDDSRKMKSGNLFVAVKGASYDGHDYILKAIKKGARVIVGEKNPRKIWVKKAVYIKVNNSRKALSLIASSWYKNPAKEMYLIGVTGTDGQTTTANMIAFLLKKSKIKTGLISTLGAFIGNKSFKTGLHVTNPEPLVFQKLLYNMVKQKMTHAVLEVTSHGLDQERVWGIKFDVSVLTNITREHLDYHKNLSAYIKAKSKLFNNSKVAILNKDDKNFQKIIKLIKPQVEVKTYSYKSINPDEEKKINEIFSQKYNQTNAYAAISTVGEIGIKKQDAIKLLKQFPGLPGRMDEVDNNKNVKIYIDFAHTPNALDNLLESLKKRKNQRLIAVFGSAGGRDYEKRYFMGRSAGKHADICVLTAEDPRGEKVENISNQIEKGIRSRGGVFFDFKRKHKKGVGNKILYTKLDDRGEAIYFAINNIAKENDIIVICGKGHETSICYGNTEYPWSDREAVQMALKGMIKRINYPKDYFLYGKRVAVLGYGVEGKDLVEYLKGKAVSISVYDEKKPHELGIKDGKRKGIKYYCGRDYLKKGLRGYDYLFRSPGFYRYSKEITDAQKEGVKVSSAIKLFFDLCPSKIIGVTGTKGKGTTCALINEILKTEKKDVFLAGNIGKPCLELLPKLKEKSVVILELSSFQLIDLNKSPHISVVLNVTSDHMDWHKNVKEYVNSKVNIVSHQTEDNFAVINADYKTPSSFTKETKGRVLYFSSKKEVEGSWVIGGKIYMSGKLLGETNNLKLKGKHNWENITAAVCVTGLMGVKKGNVRKAIYNFKGLEHRLEFTGQAGGVYFYNDSYSTGPQSTKAAVESFRGDITLILGGYDKGLEYGSLINYLSSKRNLKVILLIGDLAEKFKYLLIKERYPGKILNLKYSPMSVILKKAYLNTKRKGVVLLSPAAASFDMFSDYKQRGNYFKRQVKILKKYIKQNKNIIC